MTDPQQDTVAPDPTSDLPTSGRRSSPLWRLPVLRELRSSVGLQRGMLLTGLVIVGVVVLVAVFVPLIAPYGYAQLSDADGGFGAQQPPSSAHLWGTTVGGFDVFSRVLWGTRTALFVIVVAVAMSLFVGVALGLVSGYLGGWFDRVLVVVADAVYAFPSLLLAIVMTIVISGGQSKVVGGVLAAAISITVVFVPQYFRVVRSEAARIKAEPFVEAAQVLGESTLRIIVRHVFRNATRNIPLISTLNASEAILTLAALGFLGFGIEPTSASEWGFDLNKAVSDVTSGIWWTALFPGLAIVLTVLGITLVGESMNDLSDPRLRRRKRALKAASAAAHVPARAAVPTRSEGAILDISHLDVTFATDSGDVPAVRDLSLRVAAGEVLAIVGESGSGKSVTARSVLGLLPETATRSGAVVLAGTDVLTASSARLRAMRGADVSMVFQEPSTALNPVFTVGFQIVEGLQAHNPRTPRKELKARAVAAMEQVGIPDAASRYDYYPHQFSGGQKQRIVIAMALALGAELIVADEPTTALDVTVQAEILDLLRDLRDRTGTAIVLITHNMGVVADLADRVAVMYRGEVVEVADVATLFAAPQADYTRRLLAAVPRLSVTEVDGISTETSSGEALREVSVADPVVVARGLQVVFPGGIGKPDFHAVRGVDFSIARGEVLGLVGESGSGKTTIGRTLAGLTPAAGGSLTVFGHEMVGFRERAFRPLRKQIGFVFQDPAASFNPRLTIGECVAEPLVVHRPEVGAAARAARVRELLEAVELPTSYADRYPHELSGGQRQRCSLARGIALDPELLIADEPTSALDVSVQATVLELFTQLQQRFGFAALFISHDLAVVDMLADRIGVLFHGRLVEHGTSEQVLRDPRHDYTKRLIASLPVPDPAEQAGRRELARTLRRQA